MLYFILFYFILLYYFMLNYIHSCQDETAISRIVLDPGVKAKITTCLCLSLSL